MLRKLALSSIKHNLTANSRLPSHFPPIICQCRSYIDFQVPSTKSLWQTFIPRRIIPLGTSQSASPTLSPTISLKTFSLVLDFPLRRCSPSFLSYFRTCKFMKAAARFTYRLRSHSSEVKRWMMVIDGRYKRTTDIDGS